MNNKRMFVKSKYMSMLGVNDYELLGDTKEMKIPPRSPTVFPLVKNEKIFNVYPNRHLLRFFGEIAWTLDTYKEQGWMIEYDPSFEWNPKEYKDGNKHINIGILFTKIDVVDMPNLLLFNYVCNQSGEHINKKALLDF